MQNKSDTNPRYDMVMRSIVQDLPYSVEVRISLMEQLGHLTFRRVDRG